MDKKEQFIFSEMDNDDFKVTFILENLKIKVTMDEKEKIFDVDITYDSIKKYIESKEEGKTEDLAYSYPTFEECLDNYLRRYDKYCYTISNNLMDELTDLNKLVVFDKNDENVLVQFPSVDYNGLYQSMIMYNNAHYYSKYGTNEFLAIGSDIRSVVADKQPFIMKTLIEKAALNWDINYISPSFDYYLYLNDNKEQIAQIRDDHRLHPEKKPYEYIDGVQTSAKDIKKFIQDRGILINDKYKTLERDTDEIER